MLGVIGFCAVLAIAIFFCLRKEKDLATDLATNPNALSTSNDAQ